MRTSSFLMAAFAAAAFQKTLDSDSITYLRIFPPLEAVLGYPKVSSFK